MTGPPSAAGPPSDAFASLLSGLHHAADHGLALSAVVAQAHLDGEGTSTLAEVRGLSPYLVRRQLARAENRLVKFLWSDLPHAA